MADSAASNSGRLRISLPSVGRLFMPWLGAFHRLYPGITLDIDDSDRLVDVIKEGFDAVIRSGAQATLAWPHGVWSAAAGC